MHVCKKCKSIERTKDNRCANCRREYARQKYSENSIKILFQKKLYYIENKDVINLDKRNKYKENPEPIKEKSREWAANNKDTNTARARNWRLNNLEKSRQNSKDWQKNNPEARKAITQTRRARKYGQGESFKKEDIINLEILQKDKCVYCNKTLNGQYHIDHIMPLKLGGNNSKDNIQLLCQPCNNRKSSKHPDAFLKEFKINLTGG